MSNPKVTVCITTFNRKKSLKKSIEAVLRQDFEEYELVIVDDFSSDGTEEMIKSFYHKNSKITYIKHDANKGLASARNTALKNACGDFFSFCDDDDTWPHNFLSTWYKALLDKPFTKVFFMSRVSIKSVYGLEGSLKNFMELGYTPPVASQFYSLELLKKVKGYNQKIKSGVDHDLWFEISTINPEIFWINSASGNPNPTPDKKRLTYSNDRMLKVRNSIEIWKNKFEKNFTKSFFSKLELNYQYNTDKKNIFSYFQQYNLLRACILFLKINKQIFILDLVRYFKRNKITKYMYYPTFFLKNKNIKFSLIHIKHKRNEV